MTKEEFEDISVRIRGRLLALARRFPAEAIMPLSPEDIVQDALVVLWQLSEKEYPVRDPEALAVTLTKNICVSHYRRKKTKMQLMDISGGFPATERTDRADMAAIRERLYSGLTASQKMFLAMRNEGGLSLEEISAATGRPKSSIKTTISTARKLLMEKLKKEVL